MADDLSELVTALDGFARELAGEGLKQMLDTIGVAAKQDVAEAVRRTPARRGSLADQQMSNWPREIAARYKLEGSAVVVLPSGKAAGPMRVLEDGRKAYAAGDQRTKKTRRLKSGQLKAYTATVSQKTGAARGKGTWTDALDVIERETPRRAEQALVQLGMRSLY